MFPYPSGDLHTGHWYAMAPSDVAARYKRMRGFNVMFPMGFDAFGLPAENAAIKRGIDPRDWTYANIDRMRGQLRLMGASFDWERELVTSDPDFYRWTQWWFLELYKHGLAYRATRRLTGAPVARLCSPTSRWSTDAANVPTTSSNASSSLSGSSGSLSMPKSCCASTGSNGQRAFAPGRRIGSAARRARRCRSLSMPPG